MRRSRAAFGSVLFLLVAPGVVAGLVPWLLTDWRSSNPATAVVVVGSALIALGAGVLLHAFGRCLPHCSSTSGGRVLPHGRDQGVHAEEALGLDGRCRAYAYFDKPSITATKVETLTAG